MHKILIYTVYHIVYIYIYTCTYHCTIDFASFITKIMGSHDLAHHMMFTSLVWAAVGCGHGRWLICINLQGISDDGHERNNHLTHPGRYPAQNEL